jgi:hypothetical protein
MSDYTPSEGGVERRVTPIFENLLQKHALRVALVHPPSSANQAQELKAALATHGVTDCEIMKVSSTSAAAALRRLILTLPQVQWNEFKDGWPDTFIENVQASS